MKRRGHSARHTNNIKTTCFRSFPGTILKKEKTAPQSVNDAGIVSAV